MPGAEGEKDRLRLGQRDTAQDAYPGAVRTHRQRGDVADQKLPPSWRLEDLQTSGVRHGRARRYRLSIRSCPRRGPEGSANHSHLRLDLGVLDRRGMT